MSLNLEFRNENVYTLKDIYCKICQHFKIQSTDTAPAPGL